MLKTIKTTKEMVVPESKSTLYQRWENMKSRCLNKNNKFYKNYGGRGIQICKEWLDDYYSFKEWAIKNGFDKALTLDRINNDGDYSPENCRWADLKTQQNNKSDNHKETLNGITKNVSEWAEEYKINSKLLYQRLDRGMTIEEALKTPFVRKLKMKIKGLGLRIKQHRKELGLSQNEYGRMVGTDKHSVSLWEKDSVNPGFNKLESLVMEHGLDVTGLNYVDGSKLELVWERDEDE